MRTALVGKQATGLPTFKPSREQERPSSEGLSFLNMTAAFWSTILYRELPVKFTDAVPLAATDSHFIYWNPDKVKELGWTVEEIAFVKAHEVGHYILGDLVQAYAWRDLGHVIIDNKGNTLPYEHEIMNHAMDYRINAMLIDGKIGTMPKIGLYDPSISEKGFESCIEIYAKLYQKLGGKAPQGGGFDLHIEPSAEAIKAEANGMGAIERGMAIAAAIQAAEANGMGDLPGAVRQLIGEILEPKVRWQDHLKASMQRAAGEPRHDWSKVNKRLISRPEKIIFARKSNFGCGTVVIGWDTSGSTHTFQSLFFSEMAGIVADLNPAELIVLRCDTTVHDADTLENPTDLNAFKDMVNDKGIGGGGGTSFVPFFEWIKEQGVEPDMLVVFTDGYGRFPEGEPSYPTIWASIGKTSYPFGHVVKIEQE
jgi:predicted metal-dependent peptidase